MWTGASQGTSYAPSFPPPVSSVYSSSCPGIVRGLENKSYEELPGVVDMISLGISLPEVERKYKEEAVGGQEGEFT